MATGFLYGSHGNNTRGKSKKKTLKDYNLYLKETSSQSEDNVETESLISLREETSDLSFSGHNKFEDSHVDGYFRPQLRLKSPTRQYPSIVGDEERENDEMRERRRDIEDDHNVIDGEDSQTQMFSSTDSTTKIIIKETKRRGIKEEQKESVDGGLLLKKKKNRNEESESEEKDADEKERNEDVLFFSSWSPSSSSCSTSKTTFTTNKHKEAKRTVRNNTNKRYRTITKNQKKKSELLLKNNHQTEEEEEKKDVLLQQRRQRKGEKEETGDYLIQTNNISNGKNSLQSSSNRKNISSTVLTRHHQKPQQTSSKLNNSRSHQKEYSIFSLSSHNNKRKRKSFGGFRRKSMEEGAATSSNEEENTIMSPQQQTIRADQFNKICPSPFDDVPGFRRSNTMQHRKSKRDSLNSNSTAAVGRMSKSFSFDLSSSSKVPGPVALGRDKWIQFEEDRGEENIFQEEEHQISPVSIQSPQKIDFEFFPELTSETDQMILDSHVAEKDVDSENEVDKLKEQSTGIATRSVENLLETVNKTVTLLKGSITNREISDPDERKEFVNTDTPDDLSSMISDEIISLEFDTDEEKFRDTPVKQFPDVSLFQVSVVGTNRDNLRIERKNSVDHVTKDNGSNDVLDEYPPTTQRNSWKLWYRYPDKKMKMGRRRKWTPVIAHVENNFLKLNSLNGCTPEIKREYPLHPFCSFTAPTMHKGNKDGKVHSVKLQYVKYKEIRRVKPRLGVEHVPVFTPVVKLSCRDVIALRDFMKRIETVIRQIPTYRDEDISYEREEIFIDSEDDCSYLVSGSDGVVIKYNITVQLKLRCFISGNPELKLFLNDVNNQDILSRTKEALSKENKRTNNWIVPENYEFNPCIDVKKSQDEGGVVFTPPDGCSFELLRFRLRKRNPLPITVKSSLEVLALKSVHLKAEVRVNGDGKSIRHKRNNVILYIPVPSSWSKLFLKSRLVGRIAKYLSVKSSLKSQRVSRASNARASFEISTGCARYEPAYGAIIWELGNLPIIRDGLPADATHTFQCTIELPFPLHIRDDFQPYSYLEFNIKQQMGSNVSVEEVLLSDGRVPEKWVCYRSNFTYRIEMLILEDGKERT
eukprot:TCONS_00058551-protein